jgi:hypothetical protein
MAVLRVAAVKIWAAVVGLAVVVGGLFGLARYNAEPPQAESGAVRLTLTRQGLPPLQHPYTGGAVSLNALLDDDVAVIGMRGEADGSGQEARVRTGETIDIPAGRLRLVHVWNMWQRDHDAVDVVLSPR